MTRLLAGLALASFLVEVLIRKPGDIDLKISQTLGVEMIAGSLWPEQGHLGS
jgi:hypothetical protein